MSIHLDDADIEAVKKSESCLAHCPSSNFFLKSGVFAIRKNACGRRTLRLRFGRRGRTGDV